MNAFGRPGRVNVKLLVILVLVVAVTGGGLAAGYVARKRAIAGRALEDGKAALERRDWPEACKHLQVYLEKYPDDVETLEQYAEAQLKVRPAKPENIGKAIGAYRQMLQVNRGDDKVSDRLAMLYFSVGDFIEAAYVARHRLGEDPNDGSAMMWLGRALMAQRKYPEASEEITRFLERPGNQKYIELYAMLSDIAMESQTPDSTQTAFKWLEESVKHNPESADAHVRRARFYSIVQKEPERARADLEKADQLGTADPHVRLLLAREWMSHGQHDRARAEIEHIRTLGTSAPTAAGLEPLDLALEVHQTAAELALRSGDKEGGLVLARQALGELSDTRRTLFLPYAVDLFLAAGKLDEARSTVDEFRAAVGEITRSDTVQNEKLLLIEGGMANAEGRFYEAIDRLEGIVATGEPRNPRVWRHLAYAYLKTGQERRAMAALEKYVARQQEDTDAALELARANQRVSDWPAVLKFARIVEQRQPELLEPKLLRIEAVLKGADGRLNDTQVAQLTEELRTLRSAHPKAVEVPLLQAMIAQGQGRSDEAIAVLQKAVQECERPQPAAIRLATLLNTAGQRARAIEICRATAEQQPDSAAPIVALAELQWQEDRRQEALQMLEQAAARLKGEESTKVRFALARFLHAVGREDEAAGVLRQLASENASDVQPRLGLLELPSVRSDEKESQRLIDEIRRIEGDRGLRWRFEQAKLLLRNDAWQKQPDVVIGILQRCIDGDPRWSAPVLALGGVYELLGRDDPAEQLYRRYTEVYPDHAPVVVRLLELLERQRRFSEARKILDRTPKALALSGHRTKVAIGQGDFNTAMDELRARMAADPADHASRILLARLIYQQNKDGDPAQHATNTEEALKLLEEVQRSAPDVLSAISSQVAILQAEGRNADALALLNREVERRNDFAAHLLRAEYYASMGRMDLAEQDFVKLTAFPDTQVEGFGRLGEFYQKQGKIEKAIAAYDEGLKVNADRPALRRALISALLQSTRPGDHDRGLAMLDESLQQRPNDPDLLSLRANVLLARNAPEDEKQAIALFEKVVQINPRDVAAHLQVIRYASEMGELEKATQLAARAIGANPENTGLVMVRAQLESDQNNHVAARELARGVLDSEPNNLSALSLLVRIAMRTGNLKEAEQLNERALKLGPASEEVHLAQAELLYARRKPKEAIALLEGFLQKPDARKSPRALLALADLYRMEGDYARCEERIAQAEKLAPRSLGAFILRLRLAAAQKQFDGMIAMLQERLGQDPSQSQVLLSGVSILASAPGGEASLPKIQPMLADFLAKNPRSIEGLLGQALIAYQARDVKLAEDAYRRILEIDPYHRQALNNLAWILAEDLGQLKEAAELADRGVARYPADANLLNTRGTIYFRQQLLSQAQRDLERCLQVSEDLPGTRARTLLLLAKIQVQQGEAGQAQKRLQEALELDRARGGLKPAERVEIEKLLGNPTTRVAA